jgi:hypothetical protein
MRTFVLCLTIALGFIRTAAADPITLSGSGVVTSLGDEEDVCVSCAMGVLGFSFGVPNFSELEPAERVAEAG